jgi:hypothetical protein
MVRVFRPARGEILLGSGFQMEWSMSSVPDPRDFESTWRVRFKSGKLAGLPRPGPKPTLD